MTTRANFMPILICFVGIAFLSVLDVFMKSASLLIGAYSATFLRSSLAAAVTVPLWKIKGGRWPASKTLKIHLLRGVILPPMAASFFYALTKLPIAETLAISFFAPIIALYLAAVFLDEKIGKEAIIGSLLGFTGTLIIVSSRLGAAQYDLETLKGVGAVVFSALLYAANLIVLRVQSQNSGLLEANAFNNAISMCVLGIFAPFWLVAPGDAALKDIAVATSMTIAGGFALNWAYGRAEAQKLVPIEYSGFIWAGLFGWVFFSETLSAPAIAGTVLIVAGCLYATRPGKGHHEGPMAISE